jgi:3-deoxy-7-phosphoheptulonate synthase
MVEYADIIQVGARNMQNFSLLKELSKLKHPVLLKRGLSATVTEWLTAADYLMAGGNRRVILCERGIRTYEDSVRFSMDISSIAVVKDVSHLPIIVDPSHAAGNALYVPSLAKAAIAAGADGLLIEVHPDPAQALVDGLQSLNIPAFKKLMAELKPIAEAVGRSM